ncbi:uridylate-specific endoribonuclease-like [Saccoglossus kowalevskii]|uniref:Uridylate-specific endoribonuclease n=1 Tax=Saccoglossus kowalevskii TaxID=10224 RepID=A0ABM0MNS8_SACKO|nr:PREDICTED: poly(U)-specific endoribonuclease-like [Saccoglossus kowalevskii]
MWKLFVVVFAVSVTWVKSQDTCENRCNVKYNSEYACQCNTQCDQYANCCNDYDQYCTGMELSCLNRCLENYDSRNLCHCDNNCDAAGNCCDDYIEICGDSYGELSELAQELWNLDVNRAPAGEIMLDLQALITDTSAEVDLSPKPLFSYVNPDLFLIPTYEHLWNLLDNYIRMTGTAEDLTTNELDEVNLFVDEVLSSSVMMRAHEYLASKGLVSPDYWIEFREDLKTIWLEFYTRSSGPLDSSGFEHVFVGEVKNGDVSGFHGWLNFYKEEQAGRLNYYGYTNEIKEIDAIGMQMEWDGYMKSLSSMFVGTSPEFELAIFTVCFKAMPNKVCTFDMNMYKTEIQTWKEQSKFVGSAYVMA